MTHHPLSACVKTMCVLIALIVTGACAKKREPRRAERKTPPARRASTPPRLPTLDLPDRISEAPGVWLVGLKRAKWEDAHPGQLLRLGFTMSVRYGGEKQLVIRRKGAQLVVNNRVRGLNLLFTDGKEAHRLLAQNKATVDFVVLSARHAWTLGVLKSLSRLRTNKLTIMLSLDNKPAEPIFAAIAGLRKKLYGFHVEGGTLGAASFRTLSTLTGLRHLVVGTKNSISDKDVAHLGRLTELRWLYLPRLVSFTGLKHLRRLRKLLLFRSGLTLDDAAVAALAPFENLRSLHLGFSKVSDAGLAHVARFKRLERLNLSYCKKIRGPGLVHLAGLKHLRRLDLMGIKLSPSALAPLRKLPGLRTLILRATELGDQAMAHVSSLKQLTTLSMGGLAITDAGLAQLAPLKRLRHLDLSGTRITGRGFRHLAALSELRVLSVRFAKVRPGDVAHLAKLKHLQQLDLSHTDLQDVNMTALGTLKRLRILDLANAKLSDAGLSKLAALRALRELDLGQIKLTGAGLSALRGLSRLRALDLAGTPVDDAGLAHVAKLRQLVVLNLQLTKISDAGLVHLAKLRHLRVLYLHSVRITGTGLRHLSHTGLSKLVLDGTAVTDDGLRDLGQLKQLGELNLRSTRISDAALAHVAKLPELRHLWLSRTAITDAGLKHLYGLRLDTLWLSRCKGITKAGVAAMRKRVMGYVSR